MKMGPRVLSAVAAVIFFYFNPCIVFSAQVDISDIAVTPSEAPRAGDTVTVTVTASNPEGLPIYYKFYYCANYGTSAYATTPWTMVQDYSTADSAQYTFNQAGKYIIVVRAVTDPNNEPAALPIVGHVVDVGGTDDVTLTGLSKSPSTPSAAGQTIQFAASAVTDLNDIIYYKFYYCANYGTDTYATTPWTVVQDYSTANTCNYTFPAAGDYIVVVRAVTDPNDEPEALPIAGQTVTVTPGSSTPADCGAYVAPGVWKEFDCYNLAAIGKTTGDDPFTPSWRLVGGYWQWGRKGPDSSRWYDTNTVNYAHGPSGSGTDATNEGEMNGWDQSAVSDESWSDSQKTDNDPCPAGYRIPTKNQWDGVMENNIQSETGSWSHSATSYDSARLFGSRLMLPAAGYRFNLSGSLYHRGYRGNYWSSSTEQASEDAWYLSFGGSNCITFGHLRVFGSSVRCVEE